jgi:hypothetical protein
MNMQNQPMSPSLSGVLPPYKETVLLSRLTAIDPHAFLSTSGTSFQVHPIYWNVGNSRLRVPTFVDLKETTRQSGGRGARYCEKDTAVSSYQAAWNSYSSTYELSQKVPEIRVYI